MLYMFMVNFVFDDVQIMEYDVDYLIAALH